MHGSGIKEHLKRALQSPGAVPDRSPEKLPLLEHSRAVSEIPILAQVPARGIQLHSHVWRCRGPFQQEGTVPSRREESEFCSVLPDMGWFFIFVTQRVWDLNRMFWMRASGGCARTHPQLPGCHRRASRPQKSSPTVPASPTPGFLEVTCGNPAWHADVTGIWGKCPVFLP